jgi:hypothetical protein
MGINRLNGSHAHAVYYYWEYQRERVGGGNQPCVLYDSVGALSSSVSTLKHIYLFFKFALINSS